MVWVEVVVVRHVDVISCVVTSVSLGGVVDGDVFTVLLCVGNVGVDVVVCVCSTDASGEIDFSLCVDNVEVNMTSSFCITDFDKILAD